MTHNEKAEERKIFIETKLYKKKFNGKFTILLVHSQCYTMHVPARPEGVS